MRKPARQLTKKVTAILYSEFEPLVPLCVRQRKKWSEKTSKAEYLKVIKPILDGRSSITGTERSCIFEAIWRYEKVFYGRLARICDSRLIDLKPELQAEIYHSLYMRIVETTIVLCAGRDGLLHAKNEIDTFMGILRRLSPASKAIYPPPRRYPQNLFSRWHISDLTDVLSMGMRFILEQFRKLANSKPADEMRPARQERLLKIFESAVFQNGDVFVPLVARDKNLAGTYFSMTHLFFAVASENAGATQDLMKFVRPIIGAMTKSLLPLEGTAHEVTDIGVFRETQRIAKEWKKNRSLPNLQMFKGKFRRWISKARSDARKEWRFNLSVDRLLDSVAGQDDLSKLEDRLNKEIPGFDPESQESSVNPRTTNRESELEVAARFIAVNNIRPRQHPETKEVLLIIDDMAEVLQFLITVKAKKEDKRKVRGISAETLRNWDKRKVFAAIRLPTTERLPGNRNWSRFYRMLDIPNCLSIIEAMGRKQKHETSGRRKIKAAAGYLGISASTLKRRIKRGELMPPERDDLGTMLFSESYLKSAKRLFRKK